MRCETCEHKENRFHKAPCCTCKEGSPGNLSNRMEDNYVENGN